MMPLSFLEPKLEATEIYMAGIAIFNLFCFRDLDLMTFINELNPYSWEIHQMCKYELCTSRLSKDIV